MVQGQQQSLDGVICMCYFIQSLWSQNNVTGDISGHCNLLRSKGNIARVVNQTVGYLFKSKLGWIRFPPPISPTCTFLVLGTTSRVAFL